MAGSVFDSNSPERKQIMQEQRNAFLSGMDFAPSAKLNALDQIKRGGGVGTRGAPSMGGRPSGMGGAFVGAPVVSGGGAGGYAGRRRRDNATDDGSGRGAFAGAPGYSGVNARSNPDIADAHYDGAGKLISGTNAADGAPVADATTAGALAAPAGKRLDAFRNAPPTIDRSAPSRLPKSAAPAVPTDAEVLAQSRARTAAASTRLMRGPGGQPTGQTVAGAVDDVRRKRGAFAAY